MGVPFLKPSPKLLPNQADRPLLIGLGLPSRAVFVLGPHRSGTTFLYQLLAARHALAPTTLHHLRHYPQLLAAAKEGREGQLKTELQQELAHHGILDRGIDGVQVGPDALEEYAFILRRWGGSWCVNDRTGPLLDDLMRKQKALQPQSEGVLLKNPFDFPNPCVLAKRYPRAKMVVIRRNPLRVVHSQLRNALMYAKAVEPYQRLLLEGIVPEAWMYGMLPRIQCLINEDRFAAWVARMLSKQLIHQILTHHKAVASLPPGMVHALNYESLLAHPTQELARLDAFLGLEARPDTNKPTGQARPGPLHPEVLKQWPLMQAALQGSPEAALLGEAGTP